jgi:hypothetical protein
MVQMLGNLSDEPHPAGDRHALAAIPIVKANVQRKDLKI